MLFGGAWTDPHAAELPTLVGPHAFSLAVILYTKLKLILFQPSCHSRPLNMRDFLYALVRPKTNHDLTSKTHVELYDYGLKGRQGEKV